MAWASSPLITDETTFLFLDPPANRQRDGQNHSAVSSRWPRDGSRRWSSTAVTGSEETPVTHTQRTHPQHLREPGPPKALQGADVVRPGAGRTGTSRLVGILQGT